MRVHAPSVLGTCHRPWGLGRWFGPMHICQLKPYHQEPCECSCGAKAPDRDPATYSWPSTPKATPEEGS